ncbi:hypothetical protein C2H96_19490 [Bacillus subtilis]|uniref:HAD family hydrolase n=1 Tax=Bacillus subtilis TaxID=1423 RepID=UPI00201D1767|nr:HAD family hydrolase [Bacillus subtilis]UQZ56514.1 hypothetical protein C2H96_19490 [Bacillus subtilis]UQZ65109.1 hypothetical protein C2H97_00810 [Bacillus subtilis PY79]UQZ69535.1 hypothetical protein C2I05_02795 [Bacillus subtilis]
MSIYKAVIFDLDDTIINTSQIKHLRKKPWNECYNNISTKTFALFGEDLISVLKEKNLKVGIVTNSPKPYASRVLSHHKFNYDNLICYHDCSKRKPHPDPLLMCASNLQVNPENIVSIGDNVNDIRASSQAKMLSVGVTWGESTESELKSVNADYIVNETSELVNLLKKI